MISFNITLSYFQIYLIVINFIAFGIYIYDKLIAISESKTIYRVSEIKLLVSSLLGGTAGSIVAMIIFRHKIKKVSFMVKFVLVVAMQIAAAYYMVYM